MVCRQSHARSAGASNTTREARQFGTNQSYARIVCVSVGARIKAREIRAHNQGKQSFAKHEARRAEKGERECARWIHARLSRYVYLRQATTPMSRRWKGVHGGLGVQGLGVQGLGVQGLAMQGLGVEGLGVQGFP